jgi:hypothetical protein
MMVKSHTRPRRFHPLESANLRGPKRKIQEDSYVRKAQSRAISKQGHFGPGFLMCIALIGGAVYLAYQALFFDYSGYLPPDATGTPFVPEGGFKVAATRRL